MKLSPREYRLLMEAHRLHEADELCQLHMLAYQIERASARDSQGFSLFPSFSDFFDYKEALANARGEARKKNGPLERLQEYYKNKQKGGD